MLPTAADVSGLLRVLAEHDVLFIDAVHRDPAGRSIAPEASRLRGAGHNLFMTRLGPLDVLGEIGRGRDFAQLASRSHRIDLGQDLTVSVLDLDALIEVKREAAREKDLATLPVLIRTLDERRKGRN